MVTRTNENRIAPHLANGEAVKQSQRAKPDTRCRRLKITPLHEVEPEHVDWLWRNYLPCGTLVLLVAKQGGGKSTWTCAVASAVTKGTAWPDGSGSAPKGSVLFMSAEDSLSKSLRPRLDAAGADVRKVKSIDGVIGTREDGTPEHLDLSKPADRDLIERLVVEMGDCKLLIIDTIGDYMGTQKNANNNAEVRSVLGPLRALAERQGVCIVMVTHQRKSTEGDALSAALSSTAFSAISRTHLAIGLDKSDSRKRRRIMAVCKSNLGPSNVGHAFEVHETGEFKATRIKWVGGTLSDIDVDDLVKPPQRKRGQQLREAIEWAQARLADGPVPADDIYAEAKADGHAKTTMRKALRKLKEQGKVTSKPTDGPGSPWEWRSDDTKV